MSLKRVCLSDVAKAAGTSLAVAGKALNGGSPSIRMSKATEEKILKVAAELGYSQNVMASILAGGKSKLVGVITDTQVGYRNRLLLIELEKYATQCGLRLLISATHNNMSHIRENIRDLYKFGVGGLIILAHDYLEFYDDACKALAEFPEAVFLEKPYIENRKYVETSRSNAMIELVKDAKARGKNKIGIVIGRLEAISEKKLLAEYQKALAINGISYNQNLVNFLKHSPSEVVKNSKIIVSDIINGEQPDLLFIDDAEYGTAIHCALKDILGKNINNIEIHGGNNDAFFKYVSPAIKSFDPHYEKIAEALMEKLKKTVNDVSPITIHATYSSNGDKGGVSAIV